MSAVSEIQILENPRGAWLARARGVAHNLAAQRGSVTIDEVRALCPPPDDVDPRAEGAAAAVG